MIFLTLLNLLFIPWCTYSATILDDDRDKRFYAVLAAFNVFIVGMHLVMAYHDKL